MERKERRSREVDGEGCKDGKAGSGKDERGGSRRRKRERVRDVVEGHQGML